MKPHRSLLAFCLIVAAALTAWANMPAQSAEGVGESSETTAMGAKALFESPDGETSLARQREEPASDKPAARKPGRKQYMGIAYWIELFTPGGKRVLTSASRSFKSGEKIRLNVQTNRDGYLYIVGLGSTGTSRLLFPYPGEMDNFVEKKKAYSIPKETFFKFDSNPGKETLLVLLSPGPLDELEITSPAIDVQQTRRYLQFASLGSKGIVMAEADSKSTMDVAPDKATTLDYGYASSVASVAVAPLLQMENRSDVISLYIKLKHH